MVGYQKQFNSLHDLQVKPNAYVWWHDNKRMRSAFSYMGPIKFRKASLSL